MIDQILSKTNVALTLLVVGTCPTACEGDSSTSQAQPCDCRTGWEPAASKDECVCELPDPSQQTYKQAYLELASCELDDPCPGAGFSADPYPGYWYEGECMLKALRDRTEGAYHYALSHPERMNTTDLLLIVNSDASVLLSGVTSESGYALHRSYQPTQRCTLKPSEFFEDCLAIGTDIVESFAGTTGGGDAGGAGSDAPTTCHLPGSWYEDCHPAEPVCPADE